LAGAIVAAVSARLIYRQEISSRSLYLAVIRVPFYKRILYVIILVAAIVPAWPFYLYDKFNKRKRNTPPKAAKKIEPSIEDKPLLHISSYVGDLIKKYDSVAEVEIEHMVTDSRLGDTPVPFGFNNNQWRKLLSKMQDGDELWSYSTSAESWKHLAGRSGIRLIRGDKVVDDIMTIMN
jgi:hypothetical protein